MSNWELNKELAEFQNDKKKFKAEIEKYQENYANILKNEIGKEINDVLSGKKVIKMKFTTKLKYKIKYFFERLFNTL